MVNFDTSKEYQEEALTYARAELKRVPRLIRQSQQRYGDIHSVTFDQIPHGGRSVRNRVEDRTIKQIDAQTELGQIKFAIELCTLRDQEILNACYMDPREPSGVEVVMSSGYSETSFYNHKRTALLHFTEAFRGY